MVFDMGCSDHLLTVTARPGLRNFEALPNPGADAQDPGAGGQVWHATRVERVRIPGLETVAAGAAAAEAEAPSSLTYVSIHPPFFISFFFVS